MKRAIVLLLAVLAFAACGESEAGAEIIGIWRGATSDCTTTDNNGEHVVMVITEASSDTVHVSVNTGLLKPIPTDPDQAVHCQGSAVTIDQDPSVVFSNTLTCNGTSVTYEVDVELDDEDELSGTIQVGDETCSLNLVREET